MNISRTVQSIAAGAVAVALAVTLASCSTSGETNPVPVPRPTSTGPVTVAPTETPTVIPVPVVVSGSVITPGQVLPDGVKAYPLADGTQVAVVKGQPLPAPVVADVKAKYTAIVPGALGQGASASNAGHDAATVAIKADLVAANIATGRRVIIIFPTYGQDVSDGPMVSSWSTTIFDGKSYATVAEAQASLASIVAANPTGNEVIVIGQ